MFNFKIKYIPRTKYIAVNRLSRRPPTKAELKIKAQKENINNFINTYIGYLKVTPYYKVKTMSAQSFLLKGD